MGPRKVIKETDIVEMERRVSQKVREEMKEEMREELREEMRGELRDELRDELTSSMNALFQERFIMLAKQMKLPDQVMMNMETNSPITPQNIPSSCHSGGLNSLASQEVNDQKEPQSCRLALFLHDPKQRVIVANGLWYPQMRVDHHKSIPPENVRVSIDKYEKKYGDVPIPVPSGRIKKLHQTHGGFVQWPKALVDIPTNEEIRNDNNAKRKELVTGARRNEIVTSAQSKEVVSGPQSKKVASDQHGTQGSFTKQTTVFRQDKEFQNLSKKCKVMLGSLYDFDDSQTIKVPYDKTTFLCHDDSVSFKREDIMEFLAGDCIGVSILQVFLMALLDDDVDNMCLDLFGFMCPSLISETMISSSMEESIRYMTKVIEKQRTKRFILCPYHQEYVYLVIFHLSCEHL